VNPGGRSHTYRRRVTRRGVHQVAGFTAERGAPLGWALPRGLIVLLGLAAAVIAAAGI
jgi:hypothetical protein